MKLMHIDYRFFYFMNMDRSSRFSGWSGGHMARDMDGGTNQKSEDGFTSPHDILHAIYMP